MLMNSDTGPGPTGVCISTAKSASDIARRIASRRAVLARKSDNTCAPAQGRRQSTTPSLRRPCSLRVCASVAASGVWSGSGSPRMPVSDPAKCDT